MNRYRSIGRLVTDQRYLWRQIQGERVAEAV